MGVAISNTVSVFCIQIQHHEHFPSYLSIEFEFSSSSPILGRDGYIGFAVDWTIEISMVVSYSAVVVVVGLLHAGLCQYINSMVMDMKIRIIGSANESHENIDQANRWSIYVTEIGFHNEITE